MDRVRDDTGPSHRVTRHELKTARRSSIWQEGAWDMKRKLLWEMTLIALVLMCLIDMEANAQDDDATCPCFNYEEVESIFQRGEQLTEEEGSAFFPC